jgi:preprotein translocase subunit SecB
MRAAQISLAKYSVTEFQFNVNRAFDSQKPTVIQVDDLELTREPTMLAADRRSWKVTLRLTLNAPPERNIPYSFRVEVEGTVLVDPTVKDENVERLIQINGTSLVFGVTREIIRAMTSRGPWGDVLLPTVTFWEPKPAPAAEERAQEPEPSSVATAGELARQKS